MSSIVNPTTDAGELVSGTLIPSRGGTGVSNADASTLTLGAAVSITGGGTLALGGFTLTVPATGTAALLAISNVFTARQDIRADGSSSAAGLYVPWISGDTRTSLVVGSQSTSDNQDAIDAYTGSGVAFFGRATVDNGIPLWAELTGTETNTFRPLVIFNRRTSGTPAAGFGTGFTLRLKSSTTNDQNAGLVAVEWADPTHASRKARMSFFAYDSGSSREGLRVEASGSAPMIGFLGASAALRQTSGANLTNNVTSGGTDDTIANYTDLSVYANDAAAIRNNLYQLARKVKQVNDALRTYGLLT